MKADREQDGTTGNEQQNFWISVSDLMAGIVFIFLMILTVFSIQFKKEQNEFIAAKAELQSPAITRNKILDDLKSILEKDGLIVETKPEEGILRLSDSTLNFPEAKAFPNTEDLGNLGKVANALSIVLNCHSRTAPLKGRKNANDDAPAWCSSAKAENYQCKNKRFSGTIETVMVEGHTDAMSVRRGSGYRDNLALSAARATTVLRLLKLCDSRLARLKNRKEQPIIGASGYSSLRPIIKNNARDHRNRRIDIRLMMDLPNNALEANEYFRQKQALRQQEADKKR